MTAEYTDGRPVIYGPFGGDDPTPYQRWMDEVRRRRICCYQQHHPWRNVVRSLLGRSAGECTHPHSHDRETWMAPYLERDREERRRIARRLGDVHRRARLARALRRVPPKRGEE